MCKGRHFKMLAECQAWWIAPKEPSDEILRRLAQRVEDVHLRSYCLLCRPLLR